MVHINIIVAIWDAKGSKILCINMQDSDFYRSQVFCTSLCHLKGKGKGSPCFTYEHRHPKISKHTWVDGAVQMRIYLARVSRGNSSFLIASGFAYFYSPSR